MQIHDAFMRDVWQLQLADDGGNVAPVKAFIFSLASWAHRVSLDVLGKQLVEVDFTTQCTISSVVALPQGEYGNDPFSFAPGNFRSDFVSPPDGDALQCAAFDAGQH